MHCSIDWCGGGRREICDLRLESQYIDCSKMRSGNAAEPAHAAWRSCFESLFHPSHGPAVLAFGVGGPMGCLFSQVTLKPGSSIGSWKYDRRISIIYLHPNLDPVNIPHYASTYSSFDPPLPAFSAASILFLSVLISFPPCPPIIPIIPAAAFHGLLRSPLAG